MKSLDRLFGWTPRWRRIRGGVWERWWMLGKWPPRTKWFGPLPCEYQERVDGLTAVDGAVMSIIRLRLWDSKGDAPPPEVEHLAMPTLQCQPRGIVESEDHR